MMTIYSLKFVKEVSTKISFNHVKSNLMYIKGMLPYGGGEIVFKCPIRKQVRPVQLLDSGMIKRVRGTAYALRVSPALANRMVETAKGVLLNFIPDVYINTDQCRGKQSGKSPGFGIHLAAETTNGTIYSSEQVQLKNKLIYRVKV